MDVLGEEIDGESEVAQRETLAYVVHQVRESAVRQRSAHGKGTSTKQYFNTCEYMQRN